MLQVPVKFFRMHPDVPKPRYATSGAMCFDFYTNYMHVVEPGQSLVIESGLKVEILEGYGMNIVGRSGHGFKYDSRLSNCVGKIDSDFRGEIKVKIRNDGDTPLVINAGEAYAQGEIVPVIQAEFIEVTEEELGETARGEGGFGSTTGKKTMTWAEVLADHPRGAKIEVFGNAESTFWPNGLEYYKNTGEIPVNKGTKIAVVYGSGVVRRNVSVGSRYADEWVLDGYGSDILYWALEK